VASWVNYDDVIGQLKAHGLEVAALEVGTTKPKRCKIEGSREQRGWYWISDIELNTKTGKEWFLVGSYGVWRGTDNGAVKIKLPRNDGRPALTDDERQAIATRHRENAKRAAAARAAEADRAARRAAKVWRAYLPTGESDYLARKGVLAHGLRFSPSGNGTLVVPMGDAAGRVWALQLIRGKERGKKLEKEYFPKGMDKRGKYHLIGSVHAGSVVLLAEGYATAATLFEATALPVAVAFDANNLLPVAEALAKAYRNIKILVCGDDDYLQRCSACKKTTEIATAECQHCGEPHGKKNAGAEISPTVAMAVSGASVLPHWPFSREGKKLSDFNDLQNHPSGGSHLVRQQIEQAVAGAGWSMPLARTVGEAPKQGSGERRKAVSILPIDDAVARFVPIDDGTGKVIFDHWTQKLVNRDQMVAILPAGVRWDDVKRHPEWVTRGSYYLDQVGFDPAGDDENCELNTFTGWPTEPKAGDCSILLDLLNYLCSGEANATELYNWVLNWLAYPIQHPGAKMQSAVVVHGPQGTGKSRFFEAYGKIFGDYGIILNQGAIEDKFNADWSSRKLFVLADEIVARADMYHLKNQLKSFITGEWVRVNPKNLAAYKERNHMNMLFLSNERQPVILENDDRRHCVIWTPQKLTDDFYEEVSTEIDAGGIAALHHFLRERDLGDFKPWTKPPMTRAKRQLIDINKESVEAFLDYWQDGDLELPFCPCKSADLYKGYLQWCRDHGERHPRNDRQFNAHIDKLPGWFRGHKDVYATCHFDGKPRRTRVVVPSGEAFQQAIQVAHVTDHRHKPEKETQTQWLTVGVLAFADQLSGESA